MYAVLQRMLYSDLRPWPKYSNLKLCQWFSTLTKNCPWFCPNYIHVTIINNIECGIHFTSWYLTFDFPRLLTFAMTENKDRGTRYTGMSPLSTVMHKSLTGFWESAHWILLVLDSHIMWTHAWNLHQIWNFQHITIFKSFPTTSYWL